VIAVFVVLSTTVRLPPTLEAASDSTPAFVRLALPLAPVVESVTAPVNAFAEVSVIVALLADVVNDDVPVTVKRAFWVMFPPELTVSDPGSVPPVRTVAMLFARLAELLAPLVTSVTAPVNAFAEVSVIVALLVDVVNDDVPVTVRAPVWVRFPVLSTTVSVPPIVPVPSTVAMLLVRLAAPVPVFRDTAPVKAFACVSVSAPVPDVVNDDVPPTVSTPAWVIAVFVVLSTTVRLPPTLKAASDSAPAFVRLALPLAPVVESVTAPVRAFAEVSVIVAFDADVVNDDVPVTVRAPV
jgi:hypothetical protein